MQAKTHKDLMETYDRNEFAALITLLGIIGVVAFLATTIILIFIISQII